MDRRRVFGALLALSLREDTACFLGFVELSQMRRQTLPAFIMISSEIMSGVFPLFNSTLVVSEDNMAVGLKGACLKF
jgi:hypothetical protein